uniref:Secreted protein n=1 Tax=Nicotiana tabacum TaxID=4097 RepID=A0A1S4DKU0_TOBAC|nr:PREDICTED: uncharacterized protein LOC107830842 [Nicotiana tabacum]
MVFLSCVGIGSCWLLVSICAEFPASFFAFIRLFGTLLLLIEMLRTRATGHDGRPLVPPAVATRGRGCGRGRGRGKGKAARATLADPPVAQFRIRSQLWMLQQHQLRHQLCPL